MQNASASAADFHRLIIKTKQNETLYSSGCWGSETRRAAFSSSVLLLVPPLPLLLVLQRRAQLLDEHREHLVQRVHHAALQPLGDGGAGVVEAELLQDVVHAHRVDLPARPRDEPEGGRGGLFRNRKINDELKKSNNKRC